MIAGQWSFIKGMCITISIPYFRKYNNYYFVPSTPCDEAKSLMDLREKTECKQSIYSVFHRPWLFNCWITLSTRYTSIHGITQLVSLILICWIVIYLADTVIQCLNNWGLVFKAFLYSIHLTNIQLTIFLIPWACIGSKMINSHEAHSANLAYNHLSGADLGGRCRRCAPPPPPRWPAVF